MASSSAPSEHVGRAALEAKPRPPSASLPRPPPSSAPSTPSSSAVPEALPAQGTEGRWFYKGSQLARTLPSIKLGYTPERELKHRQLAAGFIQDMGERLNHKTEPRNRISQLCLSAAMVHMHRFYVYHPFQTFAHQDIGATALFLAGKMEDCPRKLEHIVSVWHRLKFPKDPPLNPHNSAGAQSEKYHQATQLITTLENILLQTIAFDLEIKIPHTFILSKTQTLPCHKEINKDIIEAAYWFASDILHMTTFCIRYRVTALSVICFHLSSSWAAGEAETPMIDGKAWYYSLDPDVTPELATALSKEFVDIRRSAEAEGRTTKVLQSTKFINKRAATEAAQRSAEASGQSPLPPPPAPPPSSLVPPPPPPNMGAAPSPPPGMKRVKTEPATLSLDRYRQKRSVATDLSKEGEEAAPAATSSEARKSFMPDMNSKPAAAALIGDVGRDEVMGGLGLTPKPREKDHRHSSSSARHHGERKESSSSVKREPSIKRTREEQESKASPALKRPRPTEPGKEAHTERREKDKHSHYPPHYREAGASSSQRPPSTSHKGPPAQPPSAKDRNGHRSHKEPRRPSPPTSGLNGILPPPPPAPSTPVFGLPAADALASIPVPPAQPGDSDFEEGEVVDEPPLPPGAPPPIPPPPAS